MLQVEDIHTYYGDSHILQGVSLHVDPGELVCLDWDGNPVWVRSLAQEYGPFRNRWGMGSSPVPAGDLLVVRDATDADDPLSVRSGVVPVLPAVHDLGRPGGRGVCVPRNKRIAGFTRPERPR